MGFFIVLIAVTNFINLTTSQSTIRARESGLRIILGSSQIKLRLQYLVESVMICIFSLGCAILIVALSLPFFNRITGIRLATTYLLEYLPLALLAVILIGFFAGLYPSLANTSVNTSAALSEKLKAGKSGSNLRSILVCCPVLHCYRNTCRNDGYLLPNEADQDSRNWDLIPMGFL